MGGAFVAVADDASAAYWNPAGLATGRFFSFVFDIGRTEADHARHTGSLIAVGTPPLGLSYYQLSSVAAGPLAREDEATPLARLRTSNVGVTLVQTLIDGLHLGGTLRYVYGTSAAGSAPGDLEDPLDQASTLAGTGSSAFDVDLGLMADFEKARAGIAVRNLLEAGFETPHGDTLSLTRQVRAGVAFFPTPTLSLAADADLTRSLDVTGERRLFAVGAEQRLWQERLGLRGGVRVSTAGDARPAVTLGASGAVRTGIYADGYVAIGVGQLAGSGGGVGVRVIF